MIGFGTEVQLGTDDIAKAINRSWMHAHAVVHGSGTLVAAGDRYVEPGTEIAWTIAKPAAPAPLVNPGPDFTLSRQRVSEMVVVEASSVAQMVTQTLSVDHVSGDQQWWAVVTLRAFIDVYTFWSHADPEYDPPRRYYPRQSYFTADVAITKINTPGGDVGAIAGFGSWDSRFTISDPFVEEIETKWHDDTGKRLYSPTEDIIKMRHFNPGIMLEVSPGVIELTRSSFVINEASFTLDQVYPPRATL